MNCTWSLPAWPAPTTAFLDVVGGIFGDLHPRLRRRQQRHGAGMADLERGGRILGDKGLLHRDGVRAVAGDHGGEFAMQDHQPRAQPGGGAGGDNAMGDMGQAGAVERDRAPAHAGKAGIKAENANRAGHAALCTLYVRPGVIKAHADIAGLLLLLALHRLGTDGAGVLCRQAVAEGYAKPPEPYDRRGYCGHRRCRSPGRRNRARPQKAALARQLGHQGVG